MSRLTHMDETGRARMVDVSDKTVTAREAVAEGFVRMSPQTLALAVSGDAKNVFDNIGITTYRLNGKAGGRHA